MADGFHVDLGPFFDLSSDFLAISPPGTHHWTAVNRTLAERLGCTPAEIISGHPLAAGGPAVLACSDGTHVRVEWKTVPGDGVDLWIGREVAVDLIGEIHHRIKNHMQMLVSLLNLQSSASPDSRVQEALTVARTRVHAVAKLYEPLHASPDFGWIEFGAYLRSLATEQTESGTSIETADIVLDIADALPLALIASETLRSGLLSVELAYLGTDRIRYTAVANASLDLPSRDIVDLLARQLGAELVVSGDFLSVTLTVSQA
jgi:hypothetical protein